MADSWVIARINLILYNDTEYSKYKQFIEVTDNFSRVKQMLDQTLKSRRENKEDTLRSQRKLS